MIDRRVKRVGVSKLRHLSSEELRKLGDEILILQMGDQPLAVLVGYEQYLRLQDMVQKLEETVSGYAGRLV